MHALARQILTLCLIAGLFSGCSRSDQKAGGITPATPPSTTPLATEASVTTVGPPVPDRAGMPVAPVVTAPEDRMEPESLENARLPGGGKLSADPDPARK